MSCPNCKTKMVKGAISTPGKVDTMWYSRESLLKSILGKDMAAWSCPNCGKIELVLELKK